MRALCVAAFAVCSYRVGCEGCAGLEEPASSCVDAATPFLDGGADASVALDGGTSSDAGATDSGTRVDAGFSLYVLDNGNRRVQVFDQP